MNKEVNDALHTLLNISSKDKSFSTQKQQFKIVYNYITNLQEEYNNSQITLAEEWKKRLEIEEKNKHLDNQITMLKQQNNAITEMGLDYKSRCEKAVKLIDDLDVTNSDFNFYIMSSGAFCDPKIELKSILSGDDK